MHYRAMFLAGVAAAALLPASASAQTSATPIAAQGSDNSDTVAAPQQQADTADSPSGGDSAEDVVVYGRNESRQVQTLTQRDLGTLVPGTSPLAALSKLPSVKFTSADALGTYEWSTRISVRGFTQTQLGYTLDEVPLGDLSYGNYNGLHISRAISTENIGSATLAQGAGMIDTASSSNIGGTLVFKSLDPSRDFGVDLQGTYGSADNSRLFARVSTGEFAGGIRGYVSYTRQHADKWKGYGSQDLDQVNSKLVVPLGTQVSVTGFLNYSNRKENDYQDLSLQLIDRFGYRLDNITDNYPLAVQIANALQNGTAIPAPYTSPDDVYFNAAGLRRDWLGGGTLRADLGSGLTFKATGYYHHNRGQGQWWTPYQASPGGLSPISVRTTDYRMNRGGALASVAWEIGDHTLEAGGWYEGNKFELARVFFPVDGTKRTTTDLHFLSNPFRTQFASEYRFRTWLFYVQDTWQVTDRLKVNAGVKTLDVRNRARSIQAEPGQAVIDGTITARDNFLPQVGVVYQVGEWGELFGTFAKNMRAFDPGPFGTNERVFNYIKDTLKPEKTTTFEGGVRFHTGGFEGVLAGYHVRFSNRLLSAPVGPPILGLPSLLSNVGGVTSKGLEATGTWTFTRNWSLFGSYSYNHATYDSDVQDFDGNVLQATKGVQIVDTPRHLAAAELNYDDKSLFGQIKADYMSDRLYSYTGDAEINGRTLFSLSLGYRFSGNRWLEGLEIQGNVFNLFNKRFIATLGTNGFPISDPTGSAQTLLPGAPRQAFVTIRKRF